MRMRIGGIALALFAAAASGIVLAREPESAGKIESQQLYVKELAAIRAKRSTRKATPFLLAPFCLGIFIPMPTRSPTSSRAPSPFNAPRAAAYVARRTGRLCGA